MSMQILLVSKNVVGFDNKCSAPDSTMRYWRSYIYEYCTQMRITAHMCSITFGALQYSVRGEQLSSRKMFWLGRLTADNTFSSQDIILTG